VRKAKRRSQRSNTESEDSNSNEGEREVNTAAVTDPPNINKAAKSVYDMTETKITLEYHIGKDDWELYSERLELYFVANDILAGKQVPVLLTKISPETYKLLRDLCAPAKPSEKTYAELVKIPLCPRPSKAMERCKFDQAQQAVTESITEFVARLKGLVTNCNFTDANTAIRGQLICGLKDHAIKAILFREENLTYETAYKMATAAEAAEKNATSTDNMNQAVASKTEVYAIRDGQKGEVLYRANRSNNRNRGRNRRDSWNKDQTTSRKQTSKSTELLLRKAE
jgi:hypothetical protein